MKQQVAVSRNDADAFFSLSYIATAMPNMRTVF